MLLSGAADLYNGAVTENNIRRVGVVLKTSSNEAAELGRQLLVELERLGIESILDIASAEVLGAEDGCRRSEAHVQLRSGGGPRG